MCNFDSYANSVIILIYYSQGSKFNKFIDILIEARKTYN